MAPLAPMPEDEPLRRRNTGPESISEATLTSDGSVPSDTPSGLCAYATSSIVTLGSSTYASAKAPIGLTSSEGNDIGGSMLISDELSSESHQYIYEYESDIKSEWSWGTSSTEKHFGSVSASEPISDITTAPTVEGRYSWLQSLWRNRKKNHTYYILQIVCQVAGLGNAGRWCSESIRFGFLPFLTAYLLTIVCIFFPVINLYLSLTHTVRGPIVEVLMQLRSKNVRFLIWFSVFVPMISFFQEAVVVGRSFLYVYNSFGGSTEYDQMAPLCAKLFNEQDCLQNYIGVDILNASNYPCDWYGDYCSPKIMMSADNYYVSASGAFVQYQGSFNDLGQNIFFVVLGLTALGCFLTAMDENIFRKTSKPVFMVLAVIVNMTAGIIITVKAMPAIRPGVMREVFLSYDATHFMEADIWRASFYCALFSLSLGFSTLALTSCYNPKYLHSKQLAIGMLAGDMCLSIMYAMIIHVALAYEMSTLGSSESNSLGRRGSGIQTHFHWPPYDECYHEPLDRSYSYVHEVYCYEHIPIVTQGYEPIYVHLPAVIGHIWLNNKHVAMTIHVMIYGPITAFAFNSYLGLMSGLSSLLSSSKFIADYMPWTTRNEFAIVLLFVQLPHIVLLTSSMGNTLMDLIGLWGELLAVLFIYSLMTYLCYGFNVGTLRQELGPFLFRVFFMTMYSVPIIFGAISYVFSYYGMGSVPFLGATLPLIVIWVIAFVLYKRNGIDYAIRITKLLLWENLSDFHLRYNATVRKALRKHNKITVNVKFEMVSKFRAFSVKLGVVSIKMLFLPFCGAIVSVASVDYVMQLHHSNLNQPSIISMIDASVFISVILLVVLLQYFGIDATQYLSKKREIIPEKTLKRLGNDNKEPDILTKYLEGIPLF